MTYQQPDQTPKKTRYRSFALTMWNESAASSGAGQAQADEWRCVVHDSVSQERIGFGSFDAMVAFLQTQLVDSDVEGREL